MCGITGIYTFNGEPINPEAVEAQIATIVHRGPNQGATYISPTRICGLGIRRLSIIDVAGGQQPLCNEDESIQLVYNGETYNHLDLRAELELLGHRLRTYSDGEVIVHGYEAWGPAGVLQRLRGMGVFALWDDHRQQLLIGRDRFGIKPLYYAEHAGRLYFASEIKAILTQPDFPSRVNLVALDAMLRLGFVPGPDTMFEGVYKLPAAHYLLASRGAFKIKKYWQVDYGPIAPLSEADAVEQFRAILAEAVQIHLMSEVPLGMLLSGGIDSGTLTALVVAGLDRSQIAENCANNQLSVNSGQSSVSNSQSTISAHQLKTISIGFDQPGYDESATALKLAHLLNTDHHAVTFTFADFDDYPTLMRHLEEPQCSGTALPIYKLYQACCEAGLIVVLTGEGSDELLGGYHWHRGDALVRPLLALPASLRQAIAALPLPMSTAARRVLQRGAKDIPTRYQDWLEVGGSDWQGQLLAAEVRAASPNGPNPLLTRWGEWLLNGMTVPLHQTLWLESRTRLVDFINLEVDKMSMAHSIEARVPFLDHKLWEFCAGLPASFKLRGCIEKYLLRQAVKGLLPDSTRTRRKKGLAAPYAHWLRAERLPDWVEEALSETQLRQTGLFEPPTVHALCRAHQAGQPDLGALLMGVLSTQVWAKEFRI